MSDGFERTVSVAVLAIQTAMVMGDAETSFQKDPLMSNMMDSFEKYRSAAGTNERHLQTVPPPTSFDEFCSNYLDYYSLRDSRECECIEEYSAIRCFGPHTDADGEVTYHFEMIVFDHNTGLPSGGAYCVCPKDSCTDDYHVCFYLYDPMGLPTCVYTLENPESWAENFACTSCQVCYNPDIFSPMVSDIGFNVDACFEDGKFGCIGSMLFPFGSADAPVPIPLDYTPPPIAFPPLGVPTTPTPTTVPTPQPTRSGEDLLSLAVEDPSTSLYGGQVVAECVVFSDSPYSVRNLDCRYLEETCHQSFGCGHIEQTWMFNSSSGSLQSQSTCFPHIDMCVLVQYNLTSAIPRWCGVHYSNDGETCMDCEICTEPDGRVGINLGTCEAPALDKSNGCLVDRFFIATNPELQLQSAAGNKIFASIIVVWVVSWTMVKVTL